MDAWVAAAAAGVARREAAFAAGRLCEVPFETVGEYLVGLRSLAAAVVAVPGGKEVASVPPPAAPVSERATPATVSPTPRQVPMIILAAAVSDFYRPVGEMPAHKMASAAAADDPDPEVVTLRLRRTPKCLRVLTAEWAPTAFVVSFKLETDAALVLPRARAALATTGVHMVVANLLATRYEEAWLVAPPPSGRPPADDDQGGVVRVVRPPASPEGGGEPPVIEEALVAALAAAHEAFIAGSRGG
ncbi:hypothetical protein MMPV_002738 [Pyropia vietnamensis]